MYFTKETDNQIEIYNKSKDEKERHEVFKNHISPAFEKLIENLIYVYHYYKIDDPETLKKECLTVLYEMLPRYDPSRGTKGFSYFNVIAKNWFIQKLRERSKKTKLESELYVDIDHENVRRDPNLLVNPHESTLEEKERWVSLNTAMDDWKQDAENDTETKVLDAVMFLLRNTDLVTIYNKKAVYLYLREMTGLTTKQIVINLKKIKRMYTDWTINYDENGGLPI